MTWRGIGEFDDSDREYFDNRRITPGRVIGWGLAMFVVALGVGSCSVAAMFVYGVVRALTH